MPIVTAAATGGGNTSPERKPMTAPRHALPGMAATAAIRRAGRGLVPQANHEPAASPSTLRSRRRRRPGRFRQCKPATGRVDLPSHDAPSRAGPSPSDNVPGTPAVSAPTALPGPSVTRDQPSATSTLTISGTAAMNSGSSTVAALKCSELTWASPAAVGERFDVHVNRGIVDAAIPIETDVAPARHEWPS